MKVNLKQKEAVGRQKFSKKRPLLKTDQCLVLGGKPVKPTSDIEKSALNLMNLLVNCKLPFSFLEKPGFKRFYEFANTHKHIHYAQLLPLVKKWMIDKKAFQESEDEEPDE